MSYLSSILASIDGDSTSASPTPAPAPRTAPTGQKRKANEELTGGLTKRPTTPSSAQNGFPKRPTTPGNTQNGNAAKTKPAGPPAGGQYKGSARPAGFEPAKQPQAKPQAPSSGTPAAVKAVAKPTTTSAVKPAAPTGDKPAPKKGSYAALLARAKATQETKKPVGVITHKVVTKEDRQAEVAKRKNISLRDKKSGDRSRTGSVEANSKAGEGSKSRPKPLEKSEYKGTAKPTTPVYTGSARPAHGAKPAARRYNEYAGTDEDIDDYDDEDDGYGSESDMEAGLWDVEREEQEALRQAKRDDAAELALENRLKSEKQARKQAALQQLAAARAQKKPF